MSAYTDDRPYSLDLVSAVGILLTNIQPGDLSALGIGTTTGDLHQQDV